MDIPKLSIIVTSYMVEKYLRETLKNLISQTLSDDNFEIIVIDDGSMDTSPAIIQEFANQYNNVIPVFLGKNSVGGVATAANTGLDIATGEYIGFADGDDLYDPSMFEKLLNAATRHDADLAFCNYYLLDEVNDRISAPADDGRWNDLGQSSLITLDEIGAKQILRFIAVPWRKIYRRSLLNDNQIRFPVGDYFYEDNPFHWFSVIKAKDIAVVPEKLCYHRNNRAGQTMATIDIRLFKMFEHHYTIRSWLEKEQLFKTYNIALLGWLISQMEWIGRKSPGKLHAEFFDIVSPHFRGYTKQQLRTVITNNKVGYSGSIMAILLQNNTKDQFLSFLRGDTKFNLLQQAYYHYRRFGAGQVVKVAGKRFSDLLAKSSLTRVGRNSSRQKTVHKADFDRLASKIDDLSVGILILENRINELTRAQLQAANRKL